LERISGEWIRKERVERAQGIGGGEHEGGWAFYSEETPKAHF